MASKERFVVGLINARTFSWLFDWKRKSGEGLVQFRDAATIDRARQMNFRVRRDVSCEFGRDLLENSRELADADLVGLRRNDLIRDTRIIDHVHQWAVDLLDTVPRIQQQTNPTKTPP